MKNTISIKRVYDQPEQTDGFRILIDRLWPRGLSKEKAKVDLWLKEIAPSTELRKWFNHDPEKWKEFAKRYKAEIKKNIEALTLLKSKIKEGKVTLVYGAKEERYNDAVVLQKILTK
ncbi:MAG TPA: DUF488 domain-containing protein [Chitinophagaceae bacterium]|jgi:uncharacterized protein YeaO (DUF488 family)|nr:DUF488 domain-containing protein [Chitinophagaceae bacterium]OPZ16549.1 MAG: hypothetical protein BWZ05_01854 [Bacteroidetes bacterium ADurb.BinA245]HMW65447.1 DUF488 domain-containing protein [Chitinophagaceae bacterium]HMX76759.1 DUF488 domain-containing protein [Chitinophagaceae bacterium]HNA91427.1 DUF488 domain-containing protein [Chitinophagaceae bacterium]